MLLAVNDLANARKTPYFRADLGSIGVSVAAAAAAAGAIGKELTS